MTRLTLTDYLECLVAYVRFGSMSEAGGYLGLSRRAVRDRLDALRRMTHTETNAHLAARLYPVLHPYYVIEHEQH